MTGADGIPQWINEADMIYLISLLGYKTSILILYLRLFAVNKTFRYLTWSTIFFVTGYLSANLLTQIFGCSPREKYWLPDTAGHCIDYTKAGLAYGAMNIISDLIIFVLPLPIVWRLGLTRREKAGVSIIFMSGAVYAPLPQIPSPPPLKHSSSPRRTCIVAIIRYAYIVRQNQANAEYFIWRSPSPPSPLPSPLPFPFPPSSYQN
ncbi:MAG: hypothetical protein HETSPECPRED_002731 [Heterodermia speciosa]|uniref:Rhodopsin domain-containing protein n=1 Tax=Heterodermia speciosa TaxID=116794 RepID=A0A8H3IJK9_9LECA|nr:MAG: hypothetical protein HETSPECPRED_002731 [Heterodermia speciosa]